MDCLVILFSFICHFLSPVAKLPLNLNLIKKGIKSNKKSLQMRTRSERGIKTPKKLENLFPKKIFLRNGFSSPLCLLVEGNIGAQLKNNSGAWIKKKYQKINVVNDNHDLEKINHILQWC